MTDLHALIRRRFDVREDDLPPYRGRRGKRDTLAQVLGEAGFVRGAEIGVYEGEFSELLCKTMPGLDLLGVDPWGTYTSGARTFFPGQDEGERVYATARQRLKRFDVELMRTTSMEAAALVPLASLDFVVIDGDHEFDATMMDLILWSARVRPGGLVIQHDYEVAYRVGVIPAVTAYVAAHAIREWYVTRDGVPYAFWVNP
jgi:hypothetical protein